jgi:hypothetical protein
MVWPAATAALTRGKPRPGLLSRPQAGRVRPPVRAGSGPLSAKIVQAGTPKTTTGSRTAWPPSLRNERDNDLQ